MTKNTKFLIASLFVALFLATFISPFASSKPDGLEKVAEDKGFLEHAEAEGVTVWESSPAPDYAVPGIKSEYLSTGLAGLLGTALVFIVSFLFAGLLNKKKISPGGRG